MARGLTPTMQAEIVKKKILPILFVEVQFLSGVVRLWTGMGPITWNSVVWQGIISGTGQCFGGVTGVKDSARVEAQGMTLSLLGVPKKALQQAMNECRPNYPATVYVALADVNAQTVLPDPYKAWSGKVDVPSATVTGETCTVSITVESRMMSLGSASNQRMTHEDQQLRSPGDDGFKFVGGVQNEILNWGRGVAGGPQAFVPVPRAAA